MKTSNKIITIYGVLFAVFTFGSLGLNVYKYHTLQPAIQHCLEALRDGKDKSVLVVDAGMKVSFHPKDYGSVMLFSHTTDMPEARILGDTLFVKGGESLFAPNTVRQIIKGDRIIDVPPIEEWQGGEIAF